MTAAFRCIAIETATERCSVAACDGERIAVLQLEDARASSRLLYSALRDVMAQLDLTPALLDCVAFGCGPGSFTGVRVAAAAAQGVAFAQQLPVCRVSSLAAMAIAGKLALPVAVCLDARQGEVYFGRYRLAAANQPVALQADALLRPADLQLDGAGGPMLAVGNGWSAWPEMKSRNQAVLHACMPDIWPSAADVLAIARGQFVRGECVAPADALPNYVRNQVTQ